MCFVTRPIVFPVSQVLSLYVCRLDADDVRQLQDEQPSLTLRLDASCEYSSASYGSVMSMYDNDGGGGLDGGGSEEFVDEAEAADADADPCGVWPVAVELQRAYERALDVTDDETVDTEEGEEEEGEEDVGQVAEGGVLGEAAEGGGGGVYIGRICMNDTHET